MHHLLELAPAVGLESLCASCAQPNSPPTPLRFWRGEFAVGQSSVQLQCPTLGAKGYILPAEAQQLAGSHARVDGQDVERFQPLAAGTPQQPARLLGVQRPHLLSSHLGHVHALADVARDHAPPHRLFQRPVQDSVSVLDSSGGKPAVLHLPVEPLYVHVRQPRQFNATQGRDDVAFHLPSI